MQQQPIQQIHSSPSEGTSLQPESRAITRNKNELKNISEKRRRWEVLDIIFDSLSFFLSFYAVIFAFAYQFLNVSQFLLSSGACSITIMTSVLLKCYSRHQQQRLYDKMIELIVEIEVGERLNELQLSTSQACYFRSKMRTSDTASKRKRRESMQSFRGMSASLDVADVSVSQASATPRSSRVASVVVPNSVDDPNNTSASASSSDHDSNKSARTASVASSSQTETIPPRNDNEVLFHAPASRTMRRTTVVRFEGMAPSPTSSEESFITKRSRITPAEPHPKI